MPNKHGWIPVKVNVRFMIERIERDEFPPTVVKVDGQGCQTKEVALRLLNECLERGITEI